MSSDPRDKTTWRLSTSGGIPFRLVDSQGLFERMEGKATFDVVIAAEDLAEFVAEIFPVPQRISASSEEQLISRNPLQFSGVPGLRAISLEWKRHIDGKPIDPFGIDAAADDLTYGELVICRITCANSKFDPETLLHISCQAGGEYYHTPIPGAHYELKSTDPTADSNGKPTDVNRDPIPPAIITVPQLIWTVRCEFIPKDWFEEKVLVRLRQAVGLVNESELAVLYNAPAETVLFDSFSFEEIYSWRGTGQYAGGHTHRDPNATSPVYINLEAKFIEKNIRDGDIRVGHNHFWRPGFGWRVLYLNDANDKIYKLFDLNALFDIAAEVGEDG